MSNRRNEIRDRSYDVIIVGGGVMGCVLAKVLAELAYKEQRSICILIIEAGTGGSSPEAIHQAYLDTYYGALTKTPNSPYPASVDAPSPEDLAFLKAPNDRYYVQEGRIPFGSWRPFCNRYSWRLLVVLSTINLFLPGSTCSTVSR